MRVCHVFTWVRLLFLRLDAHLFHIVTPTHATHTHVLRLLHPLHADVWSHHHTSQLDVYIDAPYVAATHVVLSHNNMTYKSAAFDLHEHVTRKQILTQQHAARTYQASQYNYDAYPSWEQIEIELMYIQVWDKKWHVAMYHVSAQFLHSSKHVRVSYVWMCMSFL